MRYLHPLSLLSVAKIGLMTLCLAGCGEPLDDTTSPSSEESHGDHDHGDDDHGSESDHDHSGWWRPEHGVPEGECTRCDSSLIADFKEKEDWCDDHERPDSQCFHCHPELETKFAARYKAKFGEQPPKPSDP